MKPKSISRRRFVMGTAAATTLVGFKGMKPYAAYADEPVSSHITCDVLVCGATPGGIAAAVAAARHGHSVVLAEYEDHIGGIVTNGLNDSELRPQHRAAVGGFFDEFTDRIIAHYREVDAANPGMPNVKACQNGFAYEGWLAEAIFNQFVEEQAPRLRLLLRHELKRATMNQERVTGAVLERREQGRGHRVQVDATVLIDATYEGDLAAMTNAEFRLGRERREEFHEPHAGKIYMKFGTSTLLPGSTGEGDKAIQSYCFRFMITSDPTNRIPVEKPEKYNRADYHYLLEDFRAGKLTSLDKAIMLMPMPKGKLEVNSHETAAATGVPSESMDLAEECWPWPQATPQERRKIYERYLTHNVGMLWMLQNDLEVPKAVRKEMRRYGWCKDEFVTNNHVPRQVYVREGRRVEGEYLLTEHDGELAEGWERTRVQPTSIGLVEWPFDSHACHRFDPAHPGVREGYTFVEHEVFQVPYGVVVPKRVDGLLVPVACSATHVAYNGLRLEPVFMALGEACGHAAHLAIQEKVTLRAAPVERLQQNILARGGVITYFDDFQGTRESFIALQWLGARGLNRGYHAEPRKRLTRAEGAQRLQRVLENMKRMWARAADDEMSGPLQAKEVMAWLQSAGFPTTGQPSLQPEPDGLTIAQFARLVYGVVVAHSS